LNKTGFTLLEVLVSLAIFAFIAVSSYALLNESLFAEGYAENKFNLVLNSTKFIYLHWDTPPSETAGWNEIESNGIDAYRIKRVPIGIYDIVRVEWTFKKEKSQVSYVFYY